MSLYTFVLQMKKLLRGVDGWLDKAVAHATAKKFDPNTLLQSRLAPDMFPLIRQVQAVCDQAKFAAARTAGKDPPSHPDTEQTVDELRKRIASVIAYLDGFSAADFEGVEGRTISLPRWEGKSLTAFDYFVEHAQPNFYFHLTATYAILRHNGVDVGKRDYLGTLSFR
jgi:uncharacterized protein